MSKKMPIILFILILLIIAFGSCIPKNIAVSLLSLSITIESAIIFVLPLIIFSLLYKASINLAQDTSKIILLIIFGVVASNLIIINIMHLIGRWIYQFDISISIHEAKNLLTADAFYHFPVLVPNYIAMLSGIILGLFSIRIFPSYAAIIAGKLELFVNYILKAITLLIPIFVTGFIVKLQFDGMILQIISDYTVIFLIIGISQLSYISFLYLISNNFNYKNTYNSIKNMFPAAFSGFSTLSSAASMPLTLIGTEKNVSNKDLVQIVIPATVNIHLIGTCIAIPCLAFAVLKNFGLHQPSISEYLLFSVLFVISQFSAAAIPGGGLIVVLPILVQYFGFNDNMLLLITTLYMLFDSIITSANILGNGAFAKMIDTVISINVKPRNNFEKGVLYEKS